MKGEEIPVNEAAQGQQEHEVVRLADGRTLAYAQYGAPEGMPVFYFPGFGGSRLAGHPDDELTASTGARVIAVDRPGVGLSSPRKGRKLLDWPDDVVALADALDLQRFAVLGWSWGGAYALACGYRIPERITCLGLVSPMGGWLVGRGAARDVSPSFRQLGRMLRVAPPAVRLFLGLQRRAALRDPHGSIRRAMVHLPDPDRTVMGQPDMRDMLVESNEEAWRQGVEGLYEDTLAVARPWGFSPADVHVPVYLWQGEADTEVLPDMARRLSQEIPTCRSTFLPDEGHMVIYRDWPEILSTLVACPDA